MSAASEVLKAPDDVIRFLGERPSGIQDYAIGRVTVSAGHQGNKYLCHTCVLNRCAHVSRIRRYREGYSE